MDWLDTLKNQQKNKNDKLEAVGYIRDILDYGDMSKNNAKKFIDNLAVQATLQDDDDIKELILDAILEGSKDPDLEKSIDLNPIIHHLNDFNDECLSYILSLLGNSGNVKYRQIIESYKGNSRLKENVE
ncbi:hypothetical protein ABVF54_08350 [Enterococcus mundtii]|uniref:Uncharacterized protein n=1 Tax=Enterococcus mundtii TaxID=53346 RepID=A0AAI8R601_ENTMU|nr:hypothetical protein [Enterococcus mundtii]MCA6774124.1 hypothetical protein [Enterococcus mundtii]QCJ56543.1 hypothetical protein DDJ96_07960 [Enterococcus mundtii]BAO07121.1 conserved hypothetical protein [Enterococcus mundtii QU 25]BBM13425.1 hypothetical protein EM151A_0183 [Enterococcus mundtii]